ncbi:MAG: zinc-dependent metalloprotease [Gemmatimonadota bacterium]
MVEGSRFPILAGFLLAALISTAPAAAQPAESHVELPSFTSASRIADPIQAFTAGMRSQAGFIPVHMDEATGQIYLEVTRLDEEFLHMVSIRQGTGTVGPDRGQTVGSQVLHFQRNGPRLLLIEANPGMTASSGDPFQLRAVEQSFPRSVHASMPIVESTGGRFLVNATDFFLSDVGNSGPSYRNAGHNAQVDRDLSFINWSQTRAFPRNTEVSVVLSFTTDSPAGVVNQIASNARSITVEQHHSMVQLPDEPLPRRAYDPRMATGSESYWDFSTPFDGTDYRARTTPRWRLIPSDPEAYLRGELVEPVAPIVIHVDPATPEPYRTAYREGIEWWNVAFEAAGFRNAIQAPDLPDGVDWMDSRYSILPVVHRTVTGPSNGGQHRDPRTGEIIRALPRMDSHRSLVDYNIYAGLLPVFEDQGIEPQITAEEFAMNRRRQHVAHEVGHTIGLPHNHISHSLDRASVMDYPFPLIDIDAQGRLDVSQAYRLSVGYSDSVAIRHAYTWFPDAESEARGLAEIAREALDRGHLYNTSNALSSSFPEVHQWVEGSDMFEALERTQAVRRLILDHFDERAIRPGEPMAWLNTRLAHGYLHHRYSVQAVVKYVGGARFYPALRGDGQTPVEPIPVADQRRALRAIYNVLSPEELAVPDRILDLIPPTPSGFQALDPWIESPAGPVLDPLAMARSFAQEVVDNLLHRERAHRVVSLHHRDPGQLSLDEVLDGLVNATWEASASRTGSQGDYRRAVERAVLDGLFTLASDEEATAEVRDAAERQLADLGAWIQSFPGDGQQDENHRGRAGREIQRYLTLGIVPPLRTGVIDMPLPWP